MEKKIIDDGVDACSTGEVETPPACEHLHIRETRVEDSRLMVDI